MPEGRFTIERGQWLAFTCYTGDLNGVHPSPISVDGIDIVAGARAIDLEFLHLAYPAGVQSKSYRLRTLKRTQSYYAAEQIETSGELTDRLIMLQPLTPTWFARWFPHKQPHMERLFDTGGKPRGDEFVRLYGSSY